MPPTQPASKTDARKSADHRGALRCHTHDIRLTPNAEGQVLNVERRVTDVQRRGKTRKSANVTCPLGCEWASVHPGAIEESRRRDREAKRAGGHRVH